MCKYVIRIIGDSGLILYWAGGSWDSVVNDAVLYEKAEAVQCIKEFKKDYLPRSGEWALGIQELTLDQIYYTIESIHEEYCVSCGYSHEDGFGFCSYISR